jgi:hypothetical protein
MNTPTGKEPDFKPETLLLAAATVYGTTYAAAVNALIHPRGGSCLEDAEGAAVSATDEFVRRYASPAYLAGLLQETPDAP